MLESLVAPSVREGGEAFRFRSGESTAPVHEGE
jgi:hypothetical protein